MPPPRLELALMPTPIRKLQRVSRHLGVGLYVTISPDSSNLATWRRAEPPRS